MDRTFRGQKRAATWAIPRTVVQVDPRTLDWCIHLCKENPVRRLSVQQHKLWRVR